MTNTFFVCSLTCEWWRIWSILLSHDTFDLVFKVLRSVKIHGGGVPVQRVDGVGVGEQLRQEGLKNVGEVWRWDAVEEKAQMRDNRMFDCHISLQMQHLLIYYLFFFHPCILDESVLIDLNYISLKDSLKFWKVICHLCPVSMANPVRQCSLSC